MGKFSELSSNARKAANTFYNWSQLANCTSERVSCLTVEHLKETSELFSALLAELEAKDEALREVAFRVSAGGYNADSVDAEVFKQKIIDGINGNSDVLVKRIAELESIRADASQVLKEIGNELGCNPDNESIMMAIDNLKVDNTALRDQRAGLAREANRLETHNARLREWNAGLAQESCELQAKLATPVRLPDMRQSVSGDRYQWSDGVFNYKQDAIALLREQGFIIEGDE